MPQVFANRADAGRRLAAAFSTYRGRRDFIVLALPPGGTPVGFEVACALEAPLCPFVVMPLATADATATIYGALASGGLLHIDLPAIRKLGITRPHLLQQIERGRADLNREEQRYYGLVRKRPRLAKKAIILVDDGTSSVESIELAIRTLREQHPSTIVLGLPHAPSALRTSFAMLSDDVVVATASSSEDLGTAYEQSDDLSDAAIRDLLRRGHCAAAE